MTDLQLIEEFNASSDLGYEVVIQRYVEMHDGIIQGLGQLHVKEDSKAKVRWADAKNDSNKLVILNYSNRRFEHLTDAEMVFVSSKRPSELAQQ